MNEKHLELIQKVIDRHNKNSFQIKGWAITVVSSVLALTGVIRNPYLCFLSLGPIVIFWILDSYFLTNERCFVSLYRCVANGNKLNVSKMELKKCKREHNNKEYQEYMIEPYSMNFNVFKELKRNNFFRVLISFTIYWFYLALFIFTIFTFFILKSNVSSLPKLKFEYVNTKTDKYTNNKICTQDLI